MGTRKKFILKFGLTACLLAILFCESFILYCHYVKHVDAVQYASEQLHTVQERIAGNGIQTANAQASDTEEKAGKKDFPKNSAASEPHLFVSAKTAIDRMLKSGSAVLSDSGIAEADGTAYPGMEGTDTEKETETRSETKIAEKNPSTRKIRHIPAESADPTGMETTSINDLLNRQGNDGLTQNMDSKIQLDAEPVLQNPELPTGCEITSLAMALRYYGYHIPKEKLADQYLEKASPGTVSYKTAFWGDPRKKDSFGCYAPVITKAANQFLARKKSSHMAYNLTGTPFDDLLVEIRMGCPVIVWGSMYIDGEIVFSYGWEIDGETVTWPSNEHCMLLIGFDTEANSVIVCDPLAGVVSYDKNAFQHHYETLEQQAIVIY